ncbi:MAG: hypothetical protein PHI12_12110 [Dehalococcoidales bacterium]|nr:hypothetical protein [Dehalococcoidales bacterium]
MKKLCLSLAGCFIAGSLLLAANVEMSYSGPSGQGDLIYKAKSTGTTNLAMGADGLYNVTMNPAYAIIFGDLTINNATVRTNATVGGTLGVTGVGTFADSIIVKTNAAITGKLTVTNTATFTAESVHNGGIDANYITTDAGSGIDAKSAGELTIGETTANAVTIGNASATAEIKSSDWTISTAGVIANAALSADQLTAATVMSAVDAGAATNLNASALHDGTVANARLDTNSQKLGLNDGGSLTNIPTSGLVLGGANIKTILDCADYSAVRTALSLRPGTDVQTESVNLDKLALNDAGSLTNIPGGNVLGNVPEAALTNAAGTLGASIGGNIPIAAITNAIPNAAAIALNDGTSLTGVTALAMSAAGLTAATAMTAVDINAATNYSGANIVAGGSVTNLYSGTVTNGITGITNVYEIVNGLIVAVTENP